MRSFFSYRIGFPGWKIAARMGLPLTVKIRILFDESARVFVAVSDGFGPHSGLIAEASSWPDLMKEVAAQIEAALAFLFGKPLPARLTPVFVTANSL